MTRVFVNGIEVDITFGKNVIFVTEAASDYSARLIFDHQYVFVDEWHGDSPEGVEVTAFIRDNDIISEMDPIFWNKYLKVS